jgi:hypothetical protein
MKLLKNMRIYMVVAGLTPMLWAGGAAKISSSSEATQKLGRVEAVAREVRSDAATMQTFNRFPDLYAPEIHKTKLTVMKNNINEMGKIVSNLHQSRENLEEWQAQLVTRLLPKLQAITDDTEAAIKFVNQKPERTFKPTYDDYINEIYDRSNAVIRSVDAYLEWASAKQRKMEVSQVRTP